MKPCKQSRPRDTIAPVREILSAAALAPDTLLVRVTDSIAPGHRLRFGFKSLASFGGKLYVREAIGIIQFIAVEDSVQFATEQHELSNQISLRICRFCWISEGIWLHR